MLPKKIYLNYVDADDDEKTWSDEPVGVADCDLQSREYTDLSQVWHPATEEPQENEWEILCQNNLGKFPKMTRKKILIFYPNSGWKGFVNLEYITRWAYLSDLLPQS